MDETESPDFEASSFGGHLTEVAWATPDGAIASYQIDPAPFWTDWSDATEAVHGITREYYQPTTAKLGDCRSADRA